MKRLNAAAELIEKNNPIKADEVQPQELKIQDHESDNGLTPPPDGENADLKVSGRGHEADSEAGDDLPYEPLETVPGSEVTTDSIVEAILLSTDEPLAPAKIAQTLGVGDAADVKKSIDALNQRYTANGLSFRIEFVAKGYQILTLPVYDRWINRLHGVRKESRLSSAALETLAVVAYKQPVLRAEIEAIRGVACGDALNRLREMDLVKIVGRAEELGRPMLYGTTKRFLEVFGLGTLDQLPEIEEILPKPADKTAVLKPADDGDSTSSN